jgi:hypothetical protein
MKMLTKLMIADALPLMLAGCNIEANAPMRTSDIQNVAQTSVPVPVNAAITASFASKSWCRDEGAMAIRALGSADVPIQEVSCQNDPNGPEAAVGQFQVSTSLIKTTGAANPQTVVGEVLGNDLARFAVFPHGKHKDLLSVGLFLNLQQFQAAQAKLLAMPVFQRGGDTGTESYSFTVTVTNDTGAMQTFYLNNVAADIDPSYAESVLSLPPGASETITLGQAAQAQLLQQGWVNFFAIKQ